MPEASITPDDTGKPIVDPDGEQVGIVADVSGDTVHVDPDPDLTDDLRATLGWGETDEGFTLDADQLERNSRADLAVFEIRSDDRATDQA